jgi:hypothetical protein
MNTGTVNLGNAHESLKEIACLIETTSASMFVIHHAQIAGKKRFRGQPAGEQRHGVHGWPAARSAEMV